MHLNNLNKLRMIQINKFMGKIEFSVTCCVLSGCYPYKADNVSNEARLLSSRVVYFIDYKEFLFSCVISISRIRMNALTQSILEKAKFLFLPDI